MAAVAIIGAGRVGLTLGRALRRSGNQVRMLTRSRRILPDPLIAETDWDEALRSAEVLILAVPDDAIAPLATAISTKYHFSAHQVILHCSGLRDRSALNAFLPSGAAIGSLHPLQSFPDSSGNPERLHGIPAVIEGDARAVAVIRNLVGPLGFAGVFEFTAGDKAKYHAAAVFVSNYVVVLADVAQRLMTEVGIAPGDARQLFAPIMRETVNNLAARSPASVLTGPVARGDAGTVNTHLQVLNGRVREIYKLLAEEAAEIAARR